MADVMEMNMEPEKIDYNTDALGDIELDFAGPEGEDELMLDEEPLIDQHMGDDYEVSLDDEMADASNEITYSDTAEIEMQVPQQAFPDEQRNTNFGEGPPSVTAESVAYAESFTEPFEAGHPDIFDHTAATAGLTQPEYLAEVTTKNPEDDRGHTPKAEPITFEQGHQSEVADNASEAAPETDTSVLAAAEEQVNSGAELSSQLTIPEPKQEEYQEQSETYHTDMPSHSHSGTVVIVEYEGTQLSLFSNAASQNIAGIPETYLLQDHTLGDSNLSTLLTACREIFRESLLPFEELQMHLSQLDLSISETDAHTCGEAVTMNTLVELYCALHRNDGNSEFKPLHIHLNRKHKALERLEYLHQALSEGKGFFDLDLDEIPEEDEQATPHAEPPSTELPASQKSGTELLDVIATLGAASESSQNAGSEVQPAAQPDAGASEESTILELQDQQELMTQDTVNAAHAPDEQATASSHQPKDQADIQTLKSVLLTETKSSSEARNDEVALAENVEKEHAHPELSTETTSVHDAVAEQSAYEIKKNVEAQEQPNTETENKDATVFEDELGPAEFDESGNENDDEEELIEGEIEEYDEEQDGGSASQEEDEELEIISIGSDEEVPEDLDDEEDYDETLDQAHPHAEPPVAQDAVEESSSPGGSTNKRARSLEYDDLESDQESKRSKPGKSSSSG